MEEASCRICRGEGTPEDPLFFPCKCRGSIKYIHQDCLMDWLKHANKSTQQCDICNEPYKFKTLFDPDTPKGMVPLGLIVSKIASSVMKSATVITSIALYATFVVIQVPMWWKFVGRLYTWIVDGQLPQPSIVQSFLFGQLDLRTAFLIDASAPVPRLAFLWHILNYTYSSGLVSIVIFILVHVFLFIDHEWVTRDEGYFKLLTKRIGNEPKRQLRELLEQQIRNLRQNNPQNVENILNVLENMNHDGADEAIREFVVDQVIPPVMRQEQEEEEEEIEQDADTWSDMEDFEENSDDDSDSDEERGRFVRRRDVVPFPNLDAPPMLPQPVRMADILNNDRFPARNQMLEPNPEPAPEAPVDEDVPEENVNLILNIGLNITMPLKAAGIADAIITVYLFVFYLLPSIMGKFLFASLTYALFGVHYLVQKTPANTVIAFIRERTVIIDYLESYITTPVYTTWSNVFNSRVPATVTERIIPLLLFYGVLLVATNAYMSYLRGDHSKTNPLSSKSARMVYKLLFEIVSTLKVFLIFNIELIFFPVYCGWLLDFCMSPVFSPELHLNMLLSSRDNPCIHPFFTNFLCRTINYWAAGTGYMFTFALFVGMIRSMILRPGVLFFIRSPEDPNARLIHDALMRPLSLQLSRISLSGSIYSGLIVFGVGGFTWLLRLATPTGFLFPVGGIDAKSVMVTNFVFMKVVHSNAELIKTCMRVYWKRVFVIVCHKMRLSSFILDIPHPTERGYVVYRNLFYRLIGTQKPDYANPQSYELALETFRTDPEVTAVFVPDGNWVRAPGNDAISRRFLKKLFVTVTKGDQLLAAPKPAVASRRLEEEEDEDDDEIVDSGSNVYSIVYKPPRFGLKIFGMVAFLCAFAFFLCVSVIAGALICGRPIVIALFLLTQSFTGHALALSGPTDLFLPNADLLSVSIGIAVEVWLLYHFKDQFQDEELHEHEQLQEVAEPAMEILEEAVPDEADIRALIDRFPLARHMLKLVLLVSIIFASGVLGTLLSIYVHTYSANMPYHYFKFGLLLTAYIYLTWQTALLHSLLFPVTLAPLFGMLTREFQLVITHGVIDNNLAGVSIRELCSRSLFPMTGRTLALAVATISIFMGYDFKEQGSFSLGRVVDRYMLNPLEFSFMCMASSAAMVLLEYTRIGLHYLQGVNEEVKNEVYARGKTLKNIDVLDE
ncbi:hypothetical protein BABINDRAFT_166791 [Babjeviella inositovora NRRL Y-12698]|uniref:RING-type E3 ubiquitin transferase n=1 Tax=Babjeviella inositovora NRRL Y-12698 TaxID=984486 RepID=A0A1E3QRJ8_9ASCO|nr:uncharacterized protein BABINDRAFT_166791 [Babjeviella inositovora NRRL Y-12698]ODQ79672.1 hypothetical protein BABINDRAFT_166791 [Babjeviella inositovora NRRL Y-12698]